MPAVANSIAFVPLAENRRELLSRLVEGLDAPALNWLAGYAAGLAAQGSGHAAAVPAAAAPAPRLTVVFGSQTGNAKRLAEQLADHAQAAGLAVRLLRADAYPVRELAAERLLAVVVSTQGDGDPPDDTLAFVEFLCGRRAPQLPELRFTVLGLGDSSYAQFCSVGRKIDARLAELGATRMRARADADVDIDSTARPWLEGTVAAVRETLAAHPPLATVTPLRPHALAAASAYGRDQPFAAELLANQRITARHSARDVRHLELSLEGSGLDYEPGDAIGVWPRNPPALVDALLAQLHLDGEHALEREGTTLPLREWLTTRRELTRLARGFIARHAARSASADLHRLLAPEQAAALAEVLRTQQVIDLVRAYPADWDADEFVAALHPLVPRLYSIASSQKAVGAEAHTTVAHIEYDAFGCTHWGAASHHLAQLDEGARAKIFIEANARFRVPADGARDIIMIGAGTGIAPFRGFVQERRALGACGRNWLLFGNTHFSGDFLYQTEWQAALKDGGLHRLHLAFSRDTAQKTYVQQRLREHGRELFDWIENGAHLYVCGDATRMARDVNAALIEVVATQGARSTEAATEYVCALLHQGRYARDVY